MKLGGQKDKSTKPAKCKSIRRASGFTLIEVLIDFMVVALVATAVMTAFSAGYSAMSLAKAKIAAVALANEKMETMRNMSYDDLATEHGTIYPPGTILDDETIIRKNINFNVHTVITYVDDDFDGDAAGTVPGKPTDIYPYDYKKVEVTVYKIGRPIHLSRLTSNVSAKAAETASETGIIRICVIDSTGAPVPDSVITIENFDVSPAVDISATTGSDGCIMVPSLPEDLHNHYHITATKNGYSSDLTYPRTAQNPNATHPDANVLIQQINNQTMIIDLLSDMNISLIDETGTAIADTDIHMYGAKDIYFNPIAYKYDLTHTTDINGEIALTDVEFDDYTFEVNGYTVVSTTPYQPSPLLPGTTLNVTITVSLNVGAVTIRDVEPTWGYEDDTIYMTIWGQNYLAGATVALQNGPTQIIGTNVVVGNVGNEETIDVEFLLSPLSKEIYDIVITNPASNPVTQIDGFEIFRVGDVICQNPPCPV